ncbi:hypothetical protein [Luteibacter sp.]|uniref:hypothetical protein n=1 Tax=Luteibacter sp. TaxID=1886636 RepID=UPI0025BE72DC|nr:hypothetical protein [Luteibacter sp.]
MPRFRGGFALLLFLGLTVVGTNVRAQEAVTPEDEFRKKIRVAEDIQPLGEAPFGEKVNLSTGDLSFEQVDIHLPGTGPSIDIARTFAMRDMAYATSGYQSGSFADWEFSLPRITTIVADQQNVRGWVVSPNGAFTGSLNRCSQFSPPPTVLPPPHDSTMSPWDPKKWWNGYQLVLPGGGSQDLLYRDAGNPLVPDGSTSKIVTLDHWVVGCLPGTANGEKGEAFLATAPDGTRYWFNQLVYGFAPQIVKPSASDVSLRAGTLMRPSAIIEGDFLVRDQASMLVTRVEDRFGNAVDYQYSGNRLARIVASDGRQVGFDYVGSSSRVQSITVQPGSANARTWRYQYRANGTALGGPLDAVVLPDGSRWTFDLAGLRDIRLSDMYEAGDCSTPPSVPGGFRPTQTVSITHPSGLTGTFNLGFLARGRSFTRKICDPKTFAVDIPFGWVTAGLYSKRLSGAGVDSTWNYRYSPPNASWSDCTGNCPTTTWTDVIAPDGKRDHYTFSNRYDGTEGQLLSVQTDDAQGTMRRLETHTYAEPNGGPWPARAGTNMMSIDNYDKTSQQRPLQRRDIVQDGVTYTWNVTAFDAFAHPLRSTRSNTMVGQPVLDQIDEVVNQTSRWVLGLPSRSVNVGSNEELSRNVYDPNSLTLSERYRFGRKVMGYTFDAQGQLASFTDGNGHTTGLENYYRGIPRIIRYPDGTAQTVAVDDLGQITAIADQTGALTSYSYDAIGRLARIDYPAGDSVAWAPKTFWYGYIGAARGVGGAHWMRMVTQGNWSQRMDYDAMLRPVAYGEAEANTGIGYRSSRTDYDWAGRKTFQSYTVDGAPDLAGMALGTVTRYDVLGRPIQLFQHTELGDLLTSTEYLAGGARRVTDPKGNVTTTRYQMLDQPSYNSVIAVEAPEGISQTIQRDIYGNPLSITQGGQGLSLTKTMTYDGEHRLCRTWEPESGSEIMAYDGADNLAWSVSGASFNGTGCGQEQVADALKTVRGYDAMNRVTSVVYPAGTEPSSFTYDARGNPATATAGMASWTFGRNKMGLLTAEVLSIDGWRWGLGYDYTPTGRLRAVLYPDGVFVDYAPNALGQPSQASAYASGVSYFPDGDVKSYTLGSGALYAADKNARQLLRNFTYGKNGTPNVSEDFAYDANGNVSQITDVSGTNQRSKAMSYDGLNRLVSATAGQLWGTESYTYDTLNNIRTLTNGSGTNTYNYDGSNLLRSIDNGASVLHSFNYDVRGNTTVKDSQTLNFDLANRLTSIPGKGSYTYDAAGRRVKKVTSQGTTYYAYNAAGQLMWELDPTTHMGSKYVYLGKKLIAKSSENIDILQPSQVSTALGVIGIPQLSTDGTTIDVTLDILNRGTRALTAHSNYPVYMAYHLVDASGNETEIPYGVDIPSDIPVGGHGSVTMHVAAAAVLGTGKLVRFSLVQARVGWFKDWPNNTTVDIGPYSACPTAGTGNLCNNVTGVTREQVNPLLTIIAGPTLSTDGQNVLTTIDIANRGSVTLASIGPHPINLGNHLIDAAGNMVANDVARQAIPEIAPGQHAAVTIATPASQLLGSNRRVQFELVQEGLHWFRDFGIAPLVAGPYVTLSGSTGSSDGTLSVGWQAIAGATAYNLRESVNGGSWVTVSSSQATSWSGTGKGTGTYGYQVQACAAGGCAPFGSTWNVDVLLPPSAPAGINVPGSSSGTVTISWPSTATATSYQVEHSYDGNWTQVYNGTATSATITETVSSNWYYRVRACNAHGCSGYVSSSYVVVVVPPTGAPTLSGGGASNNGTYGLSWTASPQATTYRVVESVNGANWTEVQNAASQSWSTAGRPEGSYRYMVQGCNSSGCTSWSNEVAVNVVLLPYTPIGFAVAAGGATSKPTVTAMWNVTALATRYELEEMTPDETVNTYGVNATSWKSVVFAMGYVRYRVRACNNYGCSGWTGYQQVYLRSGIDL